MILAIKSLVQMTLVVTALLILRTIDEIHYDRYAEEMKRQGKTPL